MTFPPPTPSVMNDYPRIFHMAWSTGLIIIWPFWDGGEFLELNSNGDDLTHIILSAVSLSISFGAGHKKTCTHHFEKVIFANSWATFIKFQIAVRQLNQESYTFFCNFKLRMIKGVAYFALFFHISLSVFLSLFLSFFYFLCLMNSGWRQSWRVLTWPEENSMWCIIIFFLSDTQQKLFRHLVGCLHLFALAQNWDVYTLSCSWLSRSIIRHFQETAHIYTWPIIWVLCEYSWLMSLLAKITLILQSFVECPHVGWWHAIIYILI